LQHALETTGEYAAEYRIVLPDGAVKWLRARGRVVPAEADGGLRLLGAAIDSTPEQEAGTRLVRVLESMGDGFYSLDQRWRFTYVNSQAEQLLGRPREQLLGRVLWEELPDSAGSSATGRHLRDSVRTGQPSTFETYYPGPLEGWYELRTWPTTDGLSVYFRDVTAQKEVERQRAAARARLSLLSRVTTALVDTLDADEAMTSLVDLLVPEVATWAAVTLVGNEDELRHSVVRHADPVRTEDTERFADLNLEVVNERSLTRTVARTGRPILRSQVEPATVRAGHLSEEMHAVLSRLGLSTVVVVPLPGRQRVLGVLVLVGDAAHGPFTEEDLDTHTELGRRVGLALDNAQLYGRQRDASVVLQRSLLAGSLPQSPQLEVRTRYLPAAAEAAAGGDWHDAIRQPSGATLLSIGDVMGHDVNATAAMGQVRTLLRGLAFDSQDSPAGVLRRVDEAMAGLRVDTLATAIVARVEDDHSRVGTRSFCWSNAGHPPPLLVRADGKVEELVSAADLLLGLDAQTPRTEHRVDLEPGDTVVLFTDGLVERRGQSLEEGLAGLQRTLAAHHDLPLDQLCEVVLHEHLAAEQDDDVALLAVRALLPG
jgi:PAS domain S-box-containing protein